MFCPNCGKEIPENGEFCTDCGTKIPKLRAVAVSKKQDKSNKEKSIFTLGLVALIVYIVAAAVATGNFLFSLLPIYIIGVIIYIFVTLLILVAFCGASGIAIYNWVATSKYKERNGKLKGKAMVGYVFSIIISILGPISVIATFVSAPFSIVLSLL